MASFAGAARRRTRYIRVVPAVARGAGRGSFDGVNNETQVTGFAGGLPRGGLIEIELARRAIGGSYCWLCLASLTIGA